MNNISSKKVIPSFIIDIAIVARYSLKSSIALDHLIDFLIFLAFRYKKVALNKFKSIFYETASYV